MKKASGMVMVATALLTILLLGGLTGAQAGAQGSVENQYASEVEAPELVGSAPEYRAFSSGAPSVSSSASATGSASSETPSASDSAFPGEPDPAEMPTARGSSSTSASSSALAAPVAPGASGDDPDAWLAEPPTCEGPGCEAEDSSADDGRTRDPREYRGFYQYDRISDSYIYWIECKSSCGVEREHPPMFECDRMIERRFFASGELRSEETTIHCHHPRFDEWMGGAEQTPDEWARENCYYMYDEEGRRLPGALLCQSGPGGKGLQDSAEDAAEVDEAIEEVEPGAGRPVGPDGSVSQGEEGVASDATLGERTTPRVVAALAAVIFGKGDGGSGGGPPPRTDGGDVVYGPVVAGTTAGTAGDARNGGVTAAGGPQTLVDNLAEVSAGGAAAGDAPVVSSGEADTEASARNDGGVSRDNSEAELVSSAPQAAILAERLFADAAVSKGDGGEDKDHLGRAGPAPAGSTDSRTEVATGNAPHGHGEYMVEDERATEKADPPGTIGLKRVRSDGGAGNRGEPAEAVAASGVEGVGQIRSFTEKGSGRWMPYGMVVLGVSFVGTTLIIRRWR